MRVAVLGAGYAGLTVARRLERALPDAELVVVDEHEYHLVQHELHRAIRRPELAGDLRIPLSEVLDPDTTVRQARVTGVDPGAGVATLDDGDLDYEFAAVCLGAETDFYDLPGVEPYATPLKSLADAEAIREGYLGSPDGRVVVGGAGLSGIQVAGELAELARERGADPEIVLLEQLDDVAPGFPRAFRSAVREELDERGVEVRTNATVVGASANAVELDRDERIAYDQFVWTGGIRGPAALGGERPRVRNDLRLGDGTFVVGDAARVVDADGEAVPASAQAAVREGRVAAENIARLARAGDADADAEGRFDPRLSRFRFDSRGWIVSVGDGAVAEVGPTVLRGPPARAAKAVVDASYLGSLGAVRRAAELVREQAGWPTRPARRWPRNW